MPTLRLRERLLDRLVSSANGAGELGLALLMTIGVVHCGGSTQTGTGEGTPDGAGQADGPLAPEAAQEGGTVVEAALGFDGSPHPMVEAPTIAPDAGSDGHISPMVEAPTPAPTDAGADASHSPMVEAPTIAPDAGSDAGSDGGHIWVEAPNNP